MSAPPKTANEAMLLPIHEITFDADGMTEAVLTVTNPANGFRNEFLVRDDTHVWRVEKHQKKGWVRVFHGLVPENLDCRRKK
ncbi:MAG TPA: hypothetical protein PKV98_18930 [Burkholderiaceae bacterium]|nr:hypothetical protein [Burkholderiaceae bacterium]